MNVVVVLFLTVLIIINLSTALFGLTLAAHIVEYEHVSPFASYGLLVAKGINCLFIMLLFKWKMWGFYGLTIVAIIQLIILLMLDASFFTACVPFIYLFITYLVLQISEKG